PRAHQGGLAALRGPSPPRPRHEREDAHPATARTRRPRAGGAARRRLHAHAARRFCPRRAAVTPRLGKQDRAGARGPDRARHAATDKLVTLPRRAFLGLLAALPLACRRHAETSEEVVDLTHTLTTSSPYIPVRDATFPFRRTPIATIPTRGVYANRWELTEHIGTHIDAPCHFSTRASCLEAIPLADLFAEAIVVDLRARAASDPDTELTLDDLAQWHAAHGPLPRRCAVLLHSGGESRWPSQERFTNTDAAGVLHFPGISRPPAERLASLPADLRIGVV